MYNITQDDDLRYIFYVGQEVIADSETVSEAKNRKAIIVAVTQNFITVEFKQRKGIFSVASKPWRESFGHNEIAMGMVR